MLLSLNNIYQDFLTLLFPEYCYACEQTLANGEILICTDCRLKLPYTNVHASKVSSEASPGFYGKVHLKFVLPFLYFKRSGRVQRLLHALKYQGVQEIGELLGNWYGASLKEEGYSQYFDLILPVPLHARKFRKRGYNQTNSFAKGLATTLEIPWSDKILKRQVHTDTQTNKNRLQRWENVENVFAVINSELVVGKRILIVDDVLTTGATLEACARMLVLAGCSEISIGAIAKA